MVGSANFSSKKVEFLNTLVTIHPQLVNISPKIIWILQNMLIYALFIDCRESHLRTFCRQIHQCARIETPP